MNGQQIRLFYSVQTKQIIHDLKHKINFVMHSPVSNSLANMTRPVDHLKSHHGPPVENHWLRGFGIF